MKRKLITLLVAGSCLFLASCGDKGATEPDENSSLSDYSSQSESRSSESESEPESQDASDSQAPKDLEQIVDELCQSEYVEDSTGTKVPDSEYLPLPDFEALPANAVFDVQWETTDGSYAAGTSFLMKTDLTENPLLITAIHFFGDEDYISGEALPEYVQGGEIYDIMKDIDAPADGTISGVFPVPDATAFGAVETASKDVAAFTVEDTSAMNAFPMASEPCKPGDMIYLAARLDSEYIYEDNLYPCVVVSDDGTDLYYILTDTFTTSGASGCPLLNSKGEVVGIHIASNGSTRYGHSISSIYEQLKASPEAQ